MHLAVGLGLAQNHPVGGEEIDLAAVDAKRPALAIHRAETLHDHIGRDDVHPRLPGKGLHRGPRAFRPHGHRMACGIDLAQPHITGGHHDHVTRAGQGTACSHRQASAPQGHGVAEIRIAFHAKISRPLGVPDLDAGEPVTQGVQFTVAHGEH